MEDAPVTPSPRALRLHREALIIDAHADTPTEFFLEPGYDFGQRHSRGHVDLPRLREGGVDVQFFIAWVPEELAGRPGASYQHASTLIDAIHRVIDRTPGARVVLDSAGIRSAREAGDLAVMIGVEGGHAIENSLEKLRHLHARGARYLTLTWNNSNDWADAAGVRPRHGGLTAFGREVVRELDRLRMLVDVSHVSEDTFYDVLETTVNPVIASHSSARALADHPRNLTDAQLRALAQNGGVVGVNFFPTFLDARYGNEFEKIEARALELQRQLTRDHGDPDRARKESREWRDRGVAALPPVPLTRLVDHIDHMVQVAGIEHVGLGSDFDGIATVPQDLPDIAALPRITDLLIQRGYSDSALRMILGENMMRVIGEVVG